MPESGNQRLIITHAVLTGLTPLIPVPIVDDLVKSYFQRRMVRGLTRIHSADIPEQDVRNLADDPGSGCVTGCLANALLFPLKLIFRKVFFFLEWKRAVDTVSRTFHQGYLLDYSLSAGWFPGQRTSSELRTAVDSVCREVGTGPVERAIRVTFAQSKTTLRASANLLKRSLKSISGKPDDAEVARAAEAVETEEERQIEGVVVRLQKSIQSIPEGYFENLRARLGVWLRINTG